MSVLTSARGRQKSKGLPAVVDTRARIRRIVRYLIVGAINTGFGLATYWFFTFILTGKIPLAYELASFFSGIVSISFSFITYKLFVFRTKGHYLREWARAYIVYGSSILLNLILLPPLVWGLEKGLKDPSVAPYLGGFLLVGITLVFSFLGHQHFTFSRSSREHRTP